MNHFELLGRLTADPKRNGPAVSFTLAIDRGKDQNGNKQTDFPRIATFGKVAETCERNLHKGARVAVEGRIQTGSYQGKDGQTVYTTDLNASRVDIIDWPDKQEDNRMPTPSYSHYPQQEQYVPPNFDAIDGNVPY